MGSTNKVRPKPACTSEGFAPGDAPRLAGLPTVPSKWSVFDAGGRWLGDVAMPPRMIPLEIGADYILGRSLDADDVPHAVMYRLDKPR